MMERLRRHFPRPAYALLTGVADGTGYAPVRTADALVMGVWPSRGLHLHGVEIKCSRHDWLRELRAPEKADQIARFCDRWWLVSAETDVRPEEIPEAWGHLVAKGDRLRVAKDAPLLDPLPISRRFLAAILRRAVEQMAADAVIERERAEAAAEARAAGIEVGGASWKGRYDDLAARVAEFEALSGVHIVDQWSLGNVAAAVAALTSGRRLTRGAVQSARLAVERAVEALDALEAAFVDAVLEPA